MPITITAEIISEYANNKRKHLAYDDSVAKYEALRVHADGDMPKHIICERRPSESEYIKDYREKIFEPMTKSNITKVTQSLSKIRRSPDWSIKWPDKQNPRIKSDETLEEYITKRYPYDFEHINNWIFAVALKNYLVDANAVILVEPINPSKAEASEYYQPFPFIFNSPQVLDYVAGDYAVLVSENTCEYHEYDSKGVLVNTLHDGMIIKYVDRNVILTFHQTGRNKEFAKAQELKHGLGFMPAFKMPGVFFKACYNTFINESRIAGMVPDMNEAARIYSDLQAEIVQHVHSEKWLYMNTECTFCNGTGKELLNEVACECTKCKGIGRIPTSPYQNHVLTPPEMGKESVPTPPAGYIQKTDVAEMCQKLYDMFKSHMFDSLASVNMQFLDSTPLNQSGTAKEVDKDELNNFVHSVAEDLVKMEDKIVFITNEYRVGSLIKDVAARRELVPMIPVPEKFDLLSSSVLVSEIADAKQNNLNNLIIATLETDYAAKKFYNNPEVAQTLILVFKLDPMPALTEEQKMIRLQNDGVTQIDYVISSNIVPFITRALYEDPKFPLKKYPDQIAVLSAMAEKKMNQSTAAGQIRRAVIEEVPPVVIEN